MRLVGDFNRTLDEPDWGEPLHMPLPADTTPATWPAEVDLILSAMEAARPQAGERRGAGRNAYRTLALLKLFADSPLDPALSLYTRDVHERGIGFITRERLPLGYGGIVELTMPDGANIAAHCTVFRCRESINGWFEGALTFTRAQPGMRG